MLDPSVVASARKYIEDGSAIAVATVAATWGSAPVPTGGLMVIAPDGRFAGSVSGGCIEADVIAEATDAIESGTTRVLDFGISDETAWRAGLACGGRIKIIVEPFAAERARDYIAAIAAPSETRVAAVELIPLDGSGGRQLFAEAAQMPTAAAAALARRKSEAVTIDGREVLINVHLPAPRLLILGATHIGQSLAQMARIAGYAVTVIDPREAFTGGDRFADTAVATAWPDQALLKLGLDAHTAIVTLTHVGHIDDEALAIALRSNCAYIGALGSRKTHTKRVERLKADGFSDAEIARIRAPVGLNIGATTPAEIAASILAEVISAFRQPAQT